jgi:hypothetical protein
MEGSITSSTQLSMLNMGVFLTKDMMIFLNFILSIDQMYQGQHQQYDA